MSDISPFGLKCEKCLELLTTRDYLQDNKYCRKCKIEKELLEMKQTSTRRSTRIRNKLLQKAKDYDITIDNIEKIEVEKEKKIENEKKPKKTKNMKKSKKE